MTGLELNKQTVIEFFAVVFNERKPSDAVAKYLNSEYIQHNPLIANAVRRQDRRALGRAPADP